MKRAFLKNIYSILFFRIILIYIVYTICRIIFYLFNADLFNEMNLSKFLTILIGGFKFDTTAIIYTNALYIFMYIVPFKIKYNSIYQSVAKYIFIFCNSFAIMANCLDFVYYKFTLKRTTSIIFTQFENEENIPFLIFQFIFQYWYATIIFVLFVIILIKSYNLIKLSSTPILKSNKYFYPISTILMFVILGLCWGGVRGGFLHSTRPITLSNAGKYVENPNEMSIVLNTPFALIRTIGKSGLDKKNYFENDSILAKYYSPIHKAKPEATFNNENVIIFILESWSREFIGFLNSDLENGNFKGYTPFFDSILENSLTFKYAFANGRKSIDALPSVLSGIPFVKVPYILSHYSSNNMQSLAYYLKDYDYHTSFFHGAPNGSMGFQSFVALAGVDEYFGKNEYNNNDDYDGIWGIWDEEFFKYFAEKISDLKQPFFTSLFSLSSHHPFKLPKKHENIFENGDIPLHPCLRYTDYALSEFFKIARKQDWFNNTLFVFTADHATFPHNEMFKNDIGTFSVPLCFYKPDGSLKYYDTTRIVQQIDILPSVLSYLGYEKDFFAFGNNIFEKDSNNFVINYVNENFQCFSDSYVIQFDRNKTVNMFNFKHDKFLKNNIVNQYPEKQSQIENYAKAFIQEYTTRMVDNKLSID